MGILRTDEGKREGTDLNVRLSIYREGGSKDLILCARSIWAEIIIFSFNGLKQKHTPC